jgi:large subunit ribosomal protein L30
MCLTVKTETMGKVKLTLIKSTAKRHPSQKATLVALGLGKTYSSVEKETNPAIEGMINKVKHVLKVEKI